MLLVSRMTCLVYRHYFCLDIKQVRVYLKIIMFNVGDCVEFCLDNRDSLNFSKRADVQGRITRINELGCFVKIIYIGYNKNILIGGRNYHLGDELYVLNTVLKSCSKMEQLIADESSEKSTAISWGWLSLSIILMLLWLFSRGKLF